MSYSPSKTKLPNTLDSIGLEYSLVRFEHESLDAFRNRILAEARDPSGPTEKQYLRTLNRKLSLLDLPVISVDLVYVDGEATAPDPFIEVTSSMVRFYSDYEAEIIDCEMNISGRETWVKDVYDMLAASSYLTVTQLEDYQPYIASDKLMYSNSISWVDAEVLPQRRVAKLLHDKIRDFYPEALELFQTDVGVPDDILATGDYCVDKANGVLFTFSDMRSLVSYSYSLWPFTLYWQPVRAYPLQDLDVDKIIASEQIGELNAPVYLRNNDLGAKFANHILGVHPLTWGR